MHRFFMKVNIFIYFFRHSNLNTSILSFSLNVTNRWQTDNTSNTKTTFLFFTDLLYSLSKLADNRVHHYPRYYCRYIL